MLAAASIVFVANLSVRNVDDLTAQLLRERAASHGLSMEEEARRILRTAVMAPPRLGDLAMQIFGPEHGLDALEIPASLPSEPPVFAE